MNDSTEDEGHRLTRRRLIQTSAASAAIAVAGCTGSSNDDEPETGTDTDTETEAGPEQTTTEQEEEPEQLADGTYYGNCWICHHNCGQQVTVEEGAAVDITGVDGHPRGSAGAGSRGTVCPKGQSQIEKVHDPDRIRQPYIRENGELQEASWDEAFSYAADRLEAFSEEHGPEKMLNAASWTTTPVVNAFWQNLYGTPERISRGIHVCAGPTFVTGGMMGVGSNNRIPDYQNSEYIIAWGRNILESFAGQFEAKGVLEAIDDNDATLVTIDPRHTETVQKSDEWLRIKPRTDGALALAMANVIIEEELYDEEFVEEQTAGFDAYQQAVEGKTPEWAAEITGLEAEQIRRVARGFAEAAPQAGISQWTGTAQYGNAWKASQNITALNGLVGNIDRPGGLRLWESAPLADPFKACEFTREEDGETKTIQGVDLPNRAEFKEPAFNKYEEYSDYPARHVEGIAHNLVPEMVENDHINGIYVHYDNPLKDGNGEAWRDAIEEMDLVIATDAYWNGVSRNADVVFPDSSQLEKDTAAAGSWNAYSDRHWVTGGKAAVQPQWNTKPDYQIIAGLAEEMGWGEYFPWEDNEEVLDDQLSEINLTLEEIESGGDNYELLGEYDYEKWQESDGPAFWFDLDHIQSFADAAEEAEMGTAPEWQPPGTYGDEPSEEFPLEFIDTRAVFFSHAGDQALDGNLDRYARRHRLEDKDYEGNYLVIHPDDADERGIETGDMVTLESATGGGELMAFVSRRTRPGLVTTEYGFGEGSVQPDEEGLNTADLHKKQMDPITGQPDRHVSVDVGFGGGD